MTLWHFILHGDDNTPNTWTWRRIGIDGTIEHASEPHPGFGEAVEDAVQNGGFLPKQHAWVVIAKSRHTHLRPGQPLGIPRDATLPPEVPPRLQ